MSRQIHPEKIRLEASSVCQLACASCPNTGKAILPVIGSGYLHLNDFQTLLRSNTRIVEIELSNYGEIFLNPDLSDIIRYAHERNVALTADNGVNLNNAGREVLEALVKYKFKRITVSIDGASNETYRHYRIKGNYEAVIENIKQINIYKKQYQSEYPLLSWQQRARLTTCKKIGSRAEHGFPA
jgi:MoaA/NifB/PqqE/SkfB family radical SAM enzyme